MRHDTRIRERMVFETTPVIKRAIKSRAGMDGIRPADVINAALGNYLETEMNQAAKRLQEASESKKASREVGKATA